MWTLIRKYFNAFILFSYDDDDDVFSFTVQFIPKHNYSLVTNFISVSKSLHFNVSFTVQININSTRDSHFVWNNSVHIERKFKQINVLSIFSFYNCGYSLNLMFPLKSY